MALGNLHGFTNTKSVKLLLKKQTQAVFPKGILSQPLKSFPLKILFTIQYILKIRSLNLTI